MAKHILMLSNTPEVIQRVRDTLEPEGYVVAVVPAEADIADEVTRHKADLVILAPNGEDEEVPAFASRTMNCLKEASNGTRPSVIFLRPRVCNGGLSAYHIGADVYLFERFHPLELVAFVRRFIGSPKG